MLGPFNDAVPERSYVHVRRSRPADFTATKNLGPAGGGHFELKIVDEDAKINGTRRPHRRRGRRSGLGNRLYGLFGPPTVDTFFGATATGNSPIVRRCARPSSTGPTSIRTRLRVLPPGTQNAPTNAGSEDTFYQTIRHGPTSARRALLRLARRAPPRPRRERRLLEHSRRSGPRPILSVLCR